MESTVQSPGPDIKTGAESGSLSSESVLNILRMILAGAPLNEVLTIIAQLVESSGDRTLCTIWLPCDRERRLYCAVAPSLPGFLTDIGPMLIGPKGGSCGAAIYRREPVYVTDILRDPVWDQYRHLLLPFGIRAVWSQPLFGRSRAQKSHRVTLSRDETPAQLTLQFPGFRSPSPSPAWGIGVSPRFPS